MQSDFKVEPKEEQQRQQLLREERISALKDFKYNDLNEEKIRYLLDDYESLFNLDLARENIGFIKRDQLIRSAFEELGEPGGTFNYTECDDYEDPNFSHLSIAAIVQNEFSKLKEEQNLSVLEIGAFNGFALSSLRKKFGDRVKVYGITGHIEDSLPEYVRVVDAHDWGNSDYFQSKEFSIIFSRYVFLHLVDPFYAISKAYSKLAQNGLLIFDLHWVRGLTREEIFYTFNHLIQTGYSVILGPSFIEDQDSLVIIKKITEKPSLNFPLKRIGFLGGRTLYRRSFDIVFKKEMNDSKHLEYKTLSEVKQNIIEIVKPYWKLNSPDGSTTCGDINDPGLFIEKHREEILTLVAMLKNIYPIDEMYIGYKLIKLTIGERCNYLTYFCKEYARRKSAPSLEMYVELMIYCAYKEIIHYQELEKFKRELTAWELPPPIIRKNYMQRLFYAGVQGAEDEKASLQTIKQLLDKRRSFLFEQEREELIQKRFKSSTLPLVDRYPISRCYSGPDFLHTSITKIIENQLAQCQESHLTVLDIGTMCNATFFREKFGDQVKSFAIIALTDKDLPDYVQIADAHYLTKISSFESQEFSIIFSHDRLSEMADPIRVISEAYLKLKINGLLIFDLKEIQGITRKEFFDILNYMKKSGYSIIQGPDFIENHNSVVIIKKMADKSHLAFPIKQVDIREERIIYETAIDIIVDEEGMLDSKQSEDKQFFKVRQNIINLTKPHWVNNPSAVDYAYNNIDDPVLFIKKYREEILTQVSSLEKIPPTYQKYRNLKVVVRAIEERCNYLTYFCKEYARRNPAPSLEMYVDCLIICAYKEIIDYQDLERFKNELAAWELPAPIEKFVFKGSHHEDEKPSLMVLQKLSRSNTPSTSNRYSFRFSQSVSDDINIVASYQRQLK